MESFETIAPITVLVCSLTALLFSFIKFYSVKRKSEGTDMMKSISVKIRKGAMTYLKRQYKTVGIFFAIMFFILTILAAKRFLSPFVPFAFLTGGFFSGLSGYVGMNIATYANTRTANGVRDGLNKGLKIAFASGSVMGLTVVGLGLFDISVWFILLKFVFKLNINEVMTAMLTFGMGASSMALFARVGGGIFTKAADVGADLVGKVEVGIPEDDPRNPACIADNVGDNVGDVAGMGADLYESYVGSIISCGALASAAGLGFNGVLVPMLIAAIGIIASIIGTFFVSTKEGATQKSLLGSLRRGTYIASILSAVVSDFYITSRQFKCILGGYFGTYRRSDDRIFHRVLHVRLLQAYKKPRKIFKYRLGDNHNRRYRVGNVVNGNTCYYNRNFGNYKLLYRRRYGKL